MFGILFVIVLFGGIIALSVFFYMGSTLVFFLIFLGLIVLYVTMFVVRPAKHFESKFLNIISSNTASVIVTVGVAITLLTPLGSPVVKRLVISGIAVVACWLILLPNFLRREFGMLIHAKLDTGLNPPWTDVIYGFIGVLLFIGALVMQHYLVDNASAE
jgi:hypothetical protein